MDSVKTSANAEGKGVCGCVLLEFLSFWLTEAYCFSSFWLTLAVAYLALA